MSVRSARRRREQRSAHAARQTQLSGHRGRQTRRKIEQLHFLRRQRRRSLFDEHVLDRAVVDGLVVHLDLCPPPCVGQQDFDGLRARELLGDGVLGLFPAGPHRDQPSVFGHGPKRTQHRGIGHVVGKLVARFIRGGDALLDDQRIAILEHDRPLGFEFQLVGILLRAEQRRGENDAENDAAGGDKRSAKRTKHGSLQGSRAKSDPAIILATRGRGCNGAVTTAPTTRGSELRAKPSRTEALPPVNARPRLPLQLPANDNLRQARGPHGRKKTAGGSSPGLRRSEHEAPANQSPLPANQSPLPAAISPLPPSTDRNGGN